MSDRDQSSSKNLLQSKSPSKARHFDTRQARQKIKHSILRNYINAWFPILGQSFFQDTRITYMDGFSGPGLFKDGSDGSPLMALKSAINHSLLNNFTAHIELIFVEKNESTAKTLKRNLEAVEMNELQKTKVSFKVINKEFATALTDFLDDPTNFGIPLLVFADPFGYNGKYMPMDLLNRVLEREKSEVLVNVMDGFVNRFCSIENRQEAISKLYGSQDWKQVLDKNLDPEQRLHTLVTAYKKFLKAEHKIHFAMKDKGNKHTYHLVFGSNHPLGLKIMKRSMVGVSQEIEVLYFSEKYSIRQIKNVINMKSVEYKDYCSEMSSKILRSSFCSQIVQGVDLAEFITNETPYHFNFKNKLKNLLNDCIEVNNRVFDSTLFKIRPKVFDSSDNLNISEEIEPQPSGFQLKENPNLSASLVKIPSNNIFISSVVKDPIQVIKRKRIPKSLITAKAPTRTKTHEASSKKNVDSETLKEDSNKDDQELDNVQKSSLSTAKKRKSASCPRISSKLRVPYDPKQTSLFKYNFTKSSDNQAPIPPE